MTATDVAAFVGAYPFRRLRHGGPEWLLRQMDRLAIEQAWVGHLPSFLYKDPGAGNEEVVRLVAVRKDRLLPVPVVHPGLPHWEDDLNRAAEVGAPAIRAYPMHQGLEPAGGAMRVLAAATGAVGLPLVLTVRFEDVRQRHPLDGAADFPPSAVRALIRSDRETRIIVTHAERSYVEEVHFGLTPGEAARLLWDVSCLWGPPENHLALLLETIGIERFTLGTGMPLRVPDAAVAKLDLLDLSDAERAQILGGNLERWRRTTHV